MGFVDLLKTSFQEYTECAIYIENMDCSIDAILSIVSTSYRAKKCA